ncbi:MAG: RNA polymerase sigma factor [bacterium]|nr:RNA polymerase sigma factor [Gammaproteobacteria bacterium]
MMEESDKFLIEQAIAGRDDAFQQLIQRYQDLVGQLVWRLIRSEQDREEICQDVFLKVYFNLDKFRFDSKFSTWLYTVTYRTALSYLRKRKLDTEPFDERIHDQSAPLQVDDELVGLLQSEISQLNVDERTSITLYHIHGCSIDEISRVTNKPAGTIKNLLFRVRKKLKQRLEPFFCDELHGELKYGLHNSSLKGVV